MGALSEAYYAVTVGRLRRAMARSAVVACDGVRAAVVDNLVGKDESVLHYVCVQVAPGAVAPALALFGNPPTNGGAWHDFVAHGPLFEQVVYPGETLYVLTSGVVTTLLVQLVVVRPEETR